MIALGVCVAALVGMTVAQLLPLPAAPLLLSGTLAMLGSILTRHSTLWRTLALMTCAAALGAARGSVARGLPPPDAPGTFAENAPSSVALELPPREPPVTAGPSAARGSVAPEVPTANVPGVASLGAAAQPLVANLAPLRLAAQAAIAAWLPEPQASLAAGILLGGSGRLDPAFKLDLQRSGLGHLVAIDGFKQVLVAATVGSFATRLVGPRLALLPIVVSVAGYTLLSGAHPSAVRAALMVVLAGLARLSGRIADPLTSLGVAVLTMAVLDPAVLFDLGLQLSLSATLGIVLLWPMIRRRLWLYRWPRLVAEPIGLSLAVSLACLPITLSVFGLVSLVSPLAHVLAVPLLPVVLLSSAALALTASLPPLAGSPPTLPAGILTEPAPFRAFTAALQPLSARLPPMPTWLPPPAWLPPLPGWLLPLPMTLPPLLPTPTWLLPLLTALPPLLPMRTWLLPLATWPLPTALPPLLPMPMWLPLMATWPLPLPLPTALPPLPTALPPAAVLAAWLAWLPTSLLVAIIHWTGSLPGAAITTGHVQPSASLALAALLLAWGIWHMPELREARLGWLHWRSQHKALLRPMGLVCACLAAALGVQCLTPDRRLHVEPLALTRGQASFIRGPTGYTAVAVLGSADPAALAAEVGERMPVWQHHLDAVIALDPAAARSVGPTLRRFPASHRLDAGSAVDLDVGARQSLRVRATAGQLLVQPRPTTSARTTSAARPESAD